MIQSVHADDAASMPAQSRLMLPGRDCVRRNDNASAFQDRMPFRRGLFNGVESDASSLLLMAQCVP